MTGFLLDSWSLFELIVRLIHSIRSSISSVVLQIIRIVCIALPSLNIHFNTARAYLFSLIVPPGYQEHHNRSDEDGDYDGPYHVVTINLIIGI